MRRDRWPWLSLLPFGLGSWAPIIAGRRYRVRMWVGAGVFWLAVTIAGLVESGSERQGHNSLAGFLIIAAWVGGAVTSFVIRSRSERLGSSLDPDPSSLDPAPYPATATGATGATGAAGEAGTPGATERRGRRDRWAWVSVIPLGLGSWAPIIAGVRCRVWWWTALGLLGPGAAIAGAVVSSSAQAAASSTHKTVGGLLLIGGWLGGIVVSFAIRPSYDRRTGWPAPQGIWPVPTARSRQWTVRYSLIAYIVTFAGANVLGLILRYPLGIHVEVGPSVLIVDAALLAGLLPLSRRRGLSRTDLGLRPTAGLRSLGLVVLGLFSYIVVTLLWLAAIQPQSSTKAASTLSGAHQPNTLNVVLAVIAISASAPIVEEIFFRGLLYRSLRNRLSVLPAALIAGCLFGLVHITGYPLDTLPVKAAFGVIACLLYERTGSLIPGIALHSFVDATAIDLALTGNNFVVLIVAGALALILFLRAAVLRMSRRPVPAP